MNSPKTKGEWNDKIENIIAKIGNCAANYYKMHTWQAQQCSKIYMRLMLMGIIIGPLTSVISSIGLTLKIQNTPSIAIINIILGFLSGLIATTMKFAKYEKKISLNKTIAAEFMTLEANINRQLSLYRQDRVSSIPYMEWLEHKYQELIATAPLLSSFVHKKFIQSSIEVIVKGEEDAVRNKEVIVKDEEIQTSREIVKKAGLTINDRLMEYEMKRFIK